MNSSSIRTMFSFTAKPQYAWVHLFPVVLSLLLSGCASTPQQGASATGRSASKEAFFKSFSELGIADSWEEARRKLGPTLQPPAFPIKRLPEIRTQSAGRQSPSYSIQLPDFMANSRGADSKEKLTSLYWLKCMPLEFEMNSSGHFVPRTNGISYIVHGLALIDPEYVGAFAAKVPDNLKCKDDDESKITLTKRIFASQVNNYLFTPRSSVVIHKGGLETRSSKKPIGSSYAKITNLAGMIQAKFEPQTQHQFALVFEKIAGDPDGRVMLIGWYKCFAPFSKDDLKGFGGADSP